MKRRTFKVISLILTITLVINVAIDPMTTAFAANKSGTEMLEQTETADTPSESPEQPEPTEKPTETPTETPKPSLPNVSEPSLEPYPIPSSSDEPLPTPTETVPVDKTIEFTAPLGLESLLNENGYLTDEGLLSLKPLPCEEEKYRQITDLGNDKYSIKLYTEPIKFRNDKGEYELIDNSIVAVDPAEDTKYEFKNAASDIEVLMSNNLEESSAIEINYMDYSIGFSPLDILRKDIQPSENINFIVADKLEKKEHKDSKKEEKTNNDNDKLGEGKTDEIREDVLDETKEYKSIEYTQTFNENIDIQITPTLTGVKEDIILYDIPEETEFSYEFEVENVVPLLRQDGNLYFVDVKNGYLVAAVAAPYMYDSKEEYSESNDIEVRLVQTGDNKYKYTLIPSREFLEDENTAYPVIIDPSVSTRSAGTIADTYITSRYSGNNYCNDANLKIGYSSDLYISRGLTRMTFPSDFQGYTITSACYYAYQNYDGSSSPTIQLASITTDWNPTTVNWSNRPGLGGVYAALTVQAVGWYVWDITSLVQGWHNGSIANYGIYIKSSDEGSNKYKRFYSCDDSTASYFDYTYYDYSGPSAPNVSTSPNATSSWTKNTNPTVYWSGISDSGSGLNRVEYKVDSSSWQTAGTTPSGNKTINVGASGSHKIYVRGVDNSGNVGETSSVTYNLDISTPNVPNHPTFDLLDGAPNSGKSQITVKFKAVADNPFGYASYYEVYKKVGSVETLLKRINHVAGTTDYSLVDSVEDNTTYSYKIKAYDSFGYNQQSAYADQTTGDRTGPEIKDTSNVSINTSDWTKNTNPTITWGTIPDEGGGTTALKYQIDSTAGTWQTLGNYSAQTGTINCSSLADGAHTIYVKAFDAKGNSSGNKSLTYKKDTKAPNAAIVFPKTDNVVPLPKETSYFISATAEDENLASWTIDYALGTDPDDNDFINHIIATDNSGADLKDGARWDFSGMQQNRKYTLRLRAEDKAGNKEVCIVKVLYALDTLEIEPQMTLRVIDKVADKDIEDGGIEVSNVDVTVDTELEGLVSNKLYANDEEIAEDVYGTPLPFNPLQYDEEADKWVYPEGSQVFLRMRSEDNNGDYYYTSATYQGHKIVDPFDDTSGLELSENMSITNSTGGTSIAPSLGSISDPAGLPDTTRTNEILSEGQVINGLVNYVELSVDESIPQGTSIEYYLVYDGGEEKIYPGVKKDINKPTNNISLKAVFEYSGMIAPSIGSWYLDVMYIAFGDSKVISNSFVDNARGFCGLTDVLHDGADGGSIKLDGFVEYPNYTYKAQGSVESTTRITPGNVWEAFLSVEEDKPDGTNILYEISTDNGGTWQSITPGTDKNVSKQWLLFDNDQKVMR